MDLKLNGKRALVTGSSSGIGEAVAHTLAQEGAHVVVHGRNAETTHAVADAIVAAGGNAAVALGDLATDTGAADVLRDALAGGPVDILVNNVGIYESTTWETVTTEHWERVLQADVLSAVRMTQGLMPQMKSRGWGRIIQMGSGTGHQPFAAFPQYGAAKAALLNLTISLSHHLRGTGVTSNIVTPGLIRVASLENLLRGVAPQFGWGESWEALEQGALRDLLPNDVGALGVPEDVAVVVALLASPLSAYVTGANWRIDGGATVGL